MLLNSIQDRHSGVRRLEANGVLTNSCICCTVYSHGHLFQHVLYEAHHPMVILVGHIDFHHGKFRVVGFIHTLVTEVFGKFIHPFKTTHNEALEVEFVGNPQIQRRI